MPWVCWVTWQGGLSPSVTEVGAGAGGGWSPPPPINPLAAPGGLVFTWLGRRCCNLLPYSCTATDPPFPGIYPGKLEAAAGGQGRGRRHPTLPPSIPARGGYCIHTSATAAQCRAPTATAPVCSVSPRKAVTQASETAQGEKKRVLSSGAAAVAGQHRLLVVKRVPRLQRLP